MDSWVYQVARALRDDFSDLPDAGRITRLVVRLMVAAALGGLLGYERERAGKAAGMRTHMLVALGSALFVLIPQQAGASAADVSRVVQGLTTGIGFLGAGAILKDVTKRETRGLTTAANVWLTAAIGVAAGMGREASAVLSAGMALLILTALPHLAGRAVEAAGAAPPGPPDGAGPPGAS